MTTMREKWTDERLDDLNHRVDLGFDRVDRRFDNVDTRFDRIEVRLDAMQRTMLQGVIALTAAILALVATQL